MILPMRLKVGSAVVGQVIGSFNKDSSNGTGGYKHHFCVCSSLGVYLWICSTARAPDFPITKKDCSELSNNTSYISLSTILRNPKFKRNARQFCVVRQEYLQRFLAHVEKSEAVSEADKRDIRNGIQRRLNDQNAC